MSIKCPNCGYPNPDNLDDCFQCHTSLKPVAPPDPPPPPVPVNPPAPPATPTPAPTPAPSARRSSQNASTLVAVVVLLLFGIWAYNHFSLQTQMNDVISGDGRNDGISVSVHFGSYLNSSRLVYDLKEVSGAKSRADVFRVFLQFAKKMASRRFDVVELRWRGEMKFLIDGGYFRTLGEEYGSQNPIYTIRTFPEHLKNPGGSEAYGQWTGGWLGVLNKQIEDFNDFHTKWYGADIVGE